ncbi:MAG: SusC/RagA family TonB-linked outer membrane protein, partial [Polaribacter sp.]
MRIQNLLLKKTKIFLFVSVALFCQLVINAQDITVKGTIIDAEDKSPIPGVSITIQGNQKGGVSSDFNGNYEIKTKIGAVLVFQYLGMKTQSIKVKNSQLNVVMISDVESLDEVVVIGYGSVKKKEITGAVTQLKSEDLESVVTSDLGSTLQGQSVGVSVVSSDLPGADSEILIRGVTSLNDNSPLYVVDGIIQDGNPRIPPSDIESLTVLRDAASTAIYGVRGATGVILITTKQGRPGTLQVRSNVSYGIQNRRSAVPLMNSIEQTYFDVIQSLNVNGTLPQDVNLQILQQPLLFQNETNLNDLVFNDSAPISNHNLTISGGKEDITYNVNLGLFNQEGLQINSAFQRFNMRANTVYNKKKLRIQSSVALNIEERDIPQSNLLSQAIVYRPTQNGLDLNVIDELTQGGDDVNRLGWVLESLRTTNVLKTTRTNASTNISYKLLDDLTLTSNLGITRINSIGKIIRPYTEIYNTQGVLQSQPENSFIDNRTRFTTNFVAELGANYLKQFKEDHKLTLTSFLTVEKNTSEAFSARRAGVTIDGSTVLNLATGTQSVTSGFDYTDTRIGILGRLQYDYKGKYIFSASLRRDGSSKFPTSNNWGTFPSISAAWNIHEEPFWKEYKNTINSFRFRASQGTVGVDRTPSYSFDPTLSADIN